MSEQQAIGAENGKVMLAASLTAGAVGTVAAALTSRRKANRERAALAARLDQQRDELAALSSAVDTRRRELAALLVGASERGRKSLKDAHVPSVDIEALSRMDWGEFSKRARKGLERARKEAAQRAPAEVAKQREALVSTGGEVAKAVRTRGEQVVEQARKRLPEMLDAVEAEVKPRADQVAGRASEVAATAAAASKQIADRATHLVDEARPELEELAERARHAVDATRPRVEEATERARTVAKQAPDAFAEELHKAEKALGALAGSAQERSSEALATVEEKAKEGAVAAKRGGKEGTSFLFWVGAAASVAYFVILNDEQRTKVREIAAAIIGEARDIYADIQGHDGTF